MFRVVLILALMLWSGLVKAAVFDVDLNRSLPPLNELQDKYMKGSSDYDWKYDNQLSIGSNFDQVFRATIDSYGQSEVRLKDQFEDNLVRMIEKLPKETYQYIGPMLFTGPGISEKVLNMPGIKETKNKFPTRIAPQLQHIEDLEYMSPYMYILLMPEVWPDYVDASERKYTPRVVPKVAYNPDFMTDLKKLVPEDEYIRGAKVPAVSLSDLRTVNPTKDSLITSADVKAFANTITKLNKFGNNLEFRNAMHQASNLIDLWENDNVAKIPLPVLKDMVNPCQRLVQKARLLGQEDEILKIVSEDNFDVEGWAYTCDKTIKAHRIAKMDAAKLAGVMAIKKGIYDEMIDADEYNFGYTRMAGQALVEMYTVPIEDVLEVKKNSKLLDEEFKKNRYRIITAPVVLR